MPTLTPTNLSLLYGKTKIFANLDLQIANLDLQIDDRDRIGIVAPNRAAKTSLIRIPLFAPITSGISTCQKRQAIRFLDTSASPT